MYFDSKGASTVFPFQASNVEDFCAAIQVQPLRAGGSTSRERPSKVETTKVNATKTREADARAAVHIAHNAALPRCVPGVSVVYAVWALANYHVADLDGRLERLDHVR
jgi:hypothetical protein